MFFHKRGAGVDFFSRLLGVHFVFVNVKKNCI